jgi:ABC-type multidrug transport system fused ATPase/permease subunit
MPEHDSALNSHLTTSHLNSYSLQHTLVALPSIQLPNANEHPLFYVYIYAAIGIGSALVTVLSSTVQYTGALRASRRLFKQLLVGVVRATMRWHDVTPQGMVV